MVGGAEEGPGPPGPPGTRRLPQRILQFCSPLRFRVAPPWRVLPLASPGSCFAPPAAPASARASPSPLSLLFSASFSRRSALAMLPPAHARVMTADFFLDFAQNAYHVSDFCLMVIPAVYVCLHSYTHPSIHSSTHPLMHLSNYPSIHPSTHPLIHLSNYATHDWAEGWTYVHCRLTSAPLFILSDDPHPVIHLSIHPLIHLGCLPCASVAV